MNVKHFKQKFGGYKNFRLMNQGDLNMVFIWRNSDHVRKFMNNPKIIAEKDHKKWFEKTLDSENDLYFIYFSQSTPIGLVCFNKIIGGSAEWGFYLGENSLPKGTGTKMLQEATDLAFKKLSLQKITATVIDSNERSHHLHKKLGFVEENGLYKLNK